MTGNTTIDKDHSEKLIPLKVSKNIENISTCKVRLVQLFVRSKIKSIEEYFCGYFFLGTTAVLT